MYRITAKQRKGAHSSNTKINFSVNIYFSAFGTIRAAFALYRYCTTKRQDYTKQNATKK
jgi:hypothetical protein